MNRSCPHKAGEVLVAALFLAAVIAGCGPNKMLPHSDQVIARNGDFVIVRAVRGDSLRSLARKYLGGSQKYRAIGRFNRVTRVKAGQEIVIPLRATNRAGVFLDGYQQVPILAYHRFVPGNGSCDRLAVSAQRFEKQLRYLKNNGFSTVSFSELADFLDGKRDIPRKSVVLSMDDGYRSNYDIAYPILKKFGFKATIFIYSDFVGSRSGLKWPQMKEMVASGLIDIQPHSKSHANLTLRRKRENETAYNARILKEVRHPARLIKNNLGLPVHTFAFPYGAENDLLISALKREGYRLGATVTRGGNPSFAPPFVLRRSQIYCDDGIRTFAKRLGTFRRVSLR